MKYLALLLPLIACSAFGAPVVVQTSAECAFPNGGAGATAVCTLNSVVAGNTIAAAVIGGEVLGGGGATASCNDGSAYTQDIHQQTLVTGSIYVFSSIHHLHNAGAGTHTVTCTNTAGTFASYGYVRLYEISGLQNVVVDVTSSNTGTGPTAATTGSATPTTTSSIAIAALTIGDFGSSVTFGDPPSGYTSLNTRTDGSACCVGAGDYKILSSTSAENPSWSYTPGNNWVATIAVYKATTASALLLRRRRQ